MTDQYQFVFVLPDGKAADTKKVDEFVAKCDGKVEKKESWGKKTFAYLINKQTAGHYFDWTLTLQNNKVDEFKRLLNLDGEVMRYLIIKN